MNVVQLRPVARASAISSAAPVWAHLAYTAMRSAEAWLAFDDLPPWTVLRQSWAYLAPYRMHETRRADVWCVVHRDHHALGCRSWTDYERAEPWHVDAEERERLLRQHVIDANGFLFTDDTAPWYCRHKMEIYVGKLRVMLAPWIEPPADGRRR